MNSKTVALFPSEARYSWHSIIRISL